MALVAPAVGDDITAALMAQVIASLTSSFTGTPIYGTYDSAKPVYHFFSSAAGTSDATNGLFTITIPTASAILTGATAPWGTATWPSLVKGRSDLCNATSVVFQTRNFTGAAVASTAYSVTVDIAYQV